jgi:hypothetical protein
MTVMEETDKKPGRGKRLFVVVAAVIAVAIVAVAVWPGEREPEYQGKKLSEWLELYTKSLYDTGDEKNPIAMEAKEAVSQIGTNAVPKLIEWLQPSPNHGRLEAARGFLHLPFGVYYVIGFFSAGAPMDHTTKAVYGFSILRERAIEALPELSRMLKDTNAVRNAVYCIGSMGKPGFDRLVAALADTNQMDRPYIASLVGQLGVDSNAAAATTALLECIKDQDPEVVASAVAGLGMAGFDGRKVPALREAVGHSNLNVRIQATNALARIHF